MHDFDPWHELRRFTQARIALGRVGASLPTQRVLEFALAHARAKDAVATPLDMPALQAQLAPSALPVVAVSSCVQQHEQFLQRPDLGRRLSEASIAALMRAHQHLSTDKTDANDTADVALVVADGLSALAVKRYGAALAMALIERLNSFKFAPLVVARFARVALGDEIGERLQARSVVVLIGERPGLSSPDSLGAYLTFAPKVGRLDAERNCVSNIREQGLPIAAAADRIAYLLREALRLGLSGVQLKDSSDLPSLSNI